MRKFFHILSGLMFVVSINLSVEAQKKHRAKTISSVQSRSSDSRLTKADYRKLIDKLLHFFEFRTEQYPGNTPHTLILFENVPDNFKEVFAEKLQNENFYYLNKKEVSRKFERTYYKINFSASLDSPVFIEISTYYSCGGSSAVFKLERKNKKWTSKIISLLTADCGSRKEELDEPPPVMKKNNQ